MKRVPAEWEKQKGILMAMPHERSDWSAYLSEAQENFLAIIREITQREACWLLVDRLDAYRDRLGGWKNLHLIEKQTNDTWARDFGPITVIEASGERVWLDFGFNGWGLKFPAFLDNGINRFLVQQGVFSETLKTKNLILEGGSIESNGAGILLTNTQCLLEGNRNPEYTQEEIEAILKEALGCEKILWLQHGYLSGDDTDSHIDTLARFIGENRIAYVKCEDKDDEHFEALHRMEEELKSLRNLRGEPFELFALPFTRPIYYEEERLPATYANFLFINGAVLLPIYNDPSDSKAIAVMQKACPQHEIIPIDCSILIRQHGSLHCVTMQIFE